MKFFTKLKLMWFGMAHVIEITDEISGRIDRLKLD